MTWLLKLCAIVQAFRITVPIWVPRSSVAAISSQCDRSEPLEPQSALTQDNEHRSLFVVSCQSIVKSNSTALQKQQGQCSNALTWYRSRDSSYGKSGRKASSREEALLFKEWRIEGRRGRPLGTVARGPLTTA